MVVITIGVNMPPPLFPRFVDAYGLSPLEITSIFATYTLCIAPALLVFGPLSDAVGRRPVLVFALVAAALATIVLGTAQDVWWLYAGRALQGLAVGASQGPAAAALADTHPTGDAARAAVAGTVATCVGTAVGPLTSGVLAQFFPAPLRLAFAVELVLVILALATLLTQFPSSAAPGGRSGRGHRLSVPPNVRAVFVRATCSAVLAWLVTALFLALAPTFLRTTLRTDNSVLSGGIVALMLVCSAMAQLGGRRSRPRKLQIEGMALLVAGLGVLLCAAAARSVSLCAVSAAVAGAGQGMAFSGSARSLTAVTPKTRRGSVMSLFFVAIYLGVTVAIVGVGFLSVRIGLLHAVQLFSVAAALGCAASVVNHLRTPTGER